MQLLEHFVREDLNKRAPRVMAVLRPLRLVIENYPGDRSSSSMPSTILKIRPLDASSSPSLRVLYIDQDDFKEDPPKQFSDSPQAARCDCVTPTSSPVSAS